MSFWLGESSFGSATLASKNGLSGEPILSRHGVGATNKKKLRHVQNPSHSSHSNQRIKFRRGYPISTHPALDRPPRAALVPPCGNGNEPCWPWANRVDEAKHLAQPHWISTDEENMSPRLEISISFKMEKYV